MHERVSWINIYIYIYVRMYVLTSSLAAEARKRKKSLDLTEIRVFKHSAYRYLHARMHPGRRLYRRWAEKRDINAVCNFSHSARMPSSRDFRGTGREREANDTQTGQKLGIRRAIYTRERKKRE